MTKQLGFISIRNEDGTSWLGQSLVWGPGNIRRAHSIEKFQELEAQAPSTTKNNCPDNGYFGLMNLKWHPCTEAEAEDQAHRADEAEARYAEEDALIETMYGEEPC